MQVSTMKSVIVLVLSMLFSAALLDLHLYLQVPNSYKIGLKALASTYGDTTAFDATFAAYYQTNDKESAPILQVVAGDFFFKEGRDINKLRSSEK